MFRLVAISAWKVYLLKGPYLLLHIMKPCFSWEFWIFYASGGHPGHVKSMPSDCCCFEDLLKEANFWNTIVGWCQDLTYSWSNCIHNCKPPTYLFPQLLPSLCISKDYKLIIHKYVYNDFQTHYLLLGSQAMSHWKNYLKGIETWIW